LQDSPNTLLAEALTDSETLELSEDKTKIRRKDLNIPSEEEINIKTLFVVCC
jgi:hypothetical protein